MSSKTKKGGQWKGKVFYDSEAFGSGKTYTIADEDLEETLGELCDLHEEIEAVTTFIATGGCLLLLLLLLLLLMLLLLLLMLRLLLLL